MTISVNMSKEVAEYFKDYDLDQVVDTLLDMYDFTALPQVERPRYTYRTINVMNEAYISLYNALGPRNKKVSLSRLLEFAYDMDVLVMPRFNEFYKGPANIEQIEKKRNKLLASRLHTAYKDLLACKDYDDSPALMQIIEFVRDYYNVIKGRC